MQLNHLNLSVKDIPASRTLFETYFDFKCVDPKLNETLSVLHGPDGFILVLMHQKMNEKGNHTYPDTFHIGFYLEDKAAVKATWERLKSGGIQLDQEPQIMRKTFGFYFTFDAMMIEITTPIKD